MIQLNFLGTGASMGIPQINCFCDVCQSQDTKDQRTRTCLWIKSPNHNLIIDIPADFRQQALKAKISNINTICISHLHSDHFLGLDEVRVFNHPINVYVNPIDWQRFQQIYDYAIIKPNKNSIYSKLLVHKAEEKKLIDCQDFKIEPFPVKHGDYEIRGFLIHLPNKKRLAFITDCKTISPQIITKLQKVDYLALACLWQNYHKHKTHLTLEEAKELIYLLKAKQTWLFHISHKMGQHKKVSPELAKNIHLAYDGLQINL